MVSEFVTSRCYKSHELAQASLLCGTVAQVIDVTHGPLVFIHNICSFLFVTFKDQIIFISPDNC